MTKEELLELAKALNPHVEGDFVIEKNVQNEYIGTAKDSIVIHQHYGEEKPKKTERTQKPERQSTLPKLNPKPKNGKPRELMTFKKKGILEANITLLYSEMVEEGWIGAETPEQDFKDLFSGKRCDCKVIWAGKYGKGTLVFLFQYMETEEVIIVEEGFTIPNILMGHFVDKDGKFLTNLDNGDPAAPKAGQEIIDLVDVLKAKPLLSGGGYSSGYDDALNPYELEKEGLRYRGNKHGSGRNSGND